VSQASIALPTGRVAVSTGAVGDRRFATLFRVAGIAALVTAVLIPLQIVAFIVWPPPDGGVTDWFDLFQRAPFIGLVSFDLAILLEEVLLIPIIAALYLLLRPRSESLMVIAAGMWLVSVALFMGSNTGFEMLALANRYGEAATEAQRAMYLAAGQAMLSAYMEQGSSFVVGYSLASIAGIFVGVAILRSRALPHLAGWAAIVANVLGFGLFLPGIGVLLSIVSVVILIVWYALVGWRLVRLHGLTEEELSDA
jgi:hypothetical protein